MQFTSVASLHTNTYGCGVATFSALLAQRLGVPFVGLNSATWGDFPLVSLKWSEVISVLGHTSVLASTSIIPLGARFGLFWHDAGYQAFTDRADVVFYADPSLGSPGLWCPSLLMPLRPRIVRLFSFGMAHKLQTQHYATVRQLLEAAGLDYRLRVSVGLHEGTSLSDATRHFAVLRDIMGADKVMILGCLSDDAVSEELAAADCVLAFFDQGVRANSTTVHAAIAAGVQVVTNWDTGTPTQLKYHTMGVDEITGWPHDRIACVRAYSWDRLIEHMEHICAATDARQQTR